MMTKVATVLCLAALAASGGCATQAGTGALAGTGVGAGIGALVGSATGSPEAGAAIGGVLGAGVGTAIGAEADQEQYRRNTDVAIAQANAAEANAPISRGPLSVEDVIRMSRPDPNNGSRVGDEVLINYIRTSGSVYNLQPSDLQYLSANGVSERVIIEMTNTRTRPQTRIVSGPPRVQTVIVREPPPVFYDPYYPGPMFVGPRYRHGSGVYIRGGF
jgi:hypothetical protein